MIAQKHWHVFKVAVSVLVAVYCVDRMRIVNRKIMLRGVDVVLVLPKVLMVNVCRVSYNTIAVLL